ncbi:hypothetical protein ACFPIJ_00155 [Dactylosporangium cerinum]|uniref:Uncharacterized protein n=1 Tax=Dactylosporangium cerinum TaxID=1434730 RepID=A0ABV9VJH7_9ACTN
MADAPAGARIGYPRQMWNTAVTEIRRLDPAAVIVGPSYSGYNHGWLDAWLARTKADGTLPGVLNWHFGNDPLADSNDAKAIMSARGVGPLPMTIDEYLFSQQQQPGYLAWYLARLAPSDVSAAAHAIWSDCCTAGTLDSVLNNGQPTGQWWVYRAYAQLTGNLVATNGAAAAALDQVPVARSCCWATRTGRPARPPSRSAASRRGCCPAAGPGSPCSASPTSHPSPGRSSSAAATSPSQAVR